MNRLPIADCRLPISRLFARCRFARCGHDGSEHIGLLQKGGQLAGRHDAGLNEQFEPQRCFISLFLDGSNFGDEFGLTAGAATSSIVCGHRSATANDLFGDDTSSIIVFWNCPGEFDDSQGKRFGARFQFGWIHAPKLQTQSAIGYRQSAMQK